MTHPHRPHRPHSSHAILTAAAFAVFGAASVGHAQITLTKTSSTSWTIVDGSITANFDPAGEEINSIKFNGGTNLLNPGGGTGGSLDQEFAGTPFGTGTQTFNSATGPNNSYVDVWTTVASTGTSTNPITYAFHYLFFANDPTIYTYEVLNHAASDPATSVGQGQFLFRGNASLFPNLYQDDLGPNSLAPQITLNIPSTNPNFATVSAQAGRSVQNAATDLTGSGIAGDNGTNFFTKYDYSTYTQFYQAETMFGSQYAVTEVVPSTETETGGPTKQMLAQTDPGILNMEFLSDHYGIDGPGSGAYPGYAYYPTQGVATSRLFGPFGFTIGSSTSLSAAQINQNAINAIPNDIAEFNTDTQLISDGYIPTPARSTVQINAADSAGWSSNPVNNTVVLSEPGVNFQESTQGDQYWGQISPTGSVTIPSVAPGAYRMSLYELGQWGETRVDGVTVAANGVVSVPQNVKFTPENFGTAAPIWTLGTPNRSANEFQNGHTATGADLREYQGSYDMWAEEQAEGTPGYVSYYATAVGSTPATNNPNQWIANQWYTFDPGLYDAANGTTDNYTNTAPAYVKSAGGPANYHGAPWQVHFAVTAAQEAQGQYVVLSVGLVSQDASLTVALNGNAETWSYNGFAPDDPQVRSGDAAFYQWAAFQFPITDLSAIGADNVFTFSVSAHTDGVMYDAMRMEITNTSANPATTGWDDYTYVNGATQVAQNDALAQTAQNLTVPQYSAWNLATGGAWGASGNWTNSSIPFQAGSVANFTSAITTASTINLNTNWSVGTVNFNNANSYTLAAGTGGILTLDNGPSIAAINDSAGTHFISAPVVLNSTTLITVTNPTDALTFSGPISGNGGVTIAGSGNVTLASANTYAGNTLVKSGSLVIAAPGALPATTSLTLGSATTTASASLAPTTGRQSVAALTIFTGSTLDLANNALVVNFASPSNDPTAQIALYLASGYNGGTWTGARLTSSSAAANPARFSVGYTDGNLDPGTAAGPNQLLIAYTLAGDADLDGSVGFSDLVAVAQNFGATGQDWSHGNFTYDPNGSVGFADLVLIAQNFGQSTPIASGIGGGSQSLSPAWLVGGPQLQSTAVNPEPSSVGLVVVAAAGLLRRRKNVGRVYSPTAPHRAG